MSYFVGDVKRFLKDKVNTVLLLIVCVFLMQIITLFLLCFSTTEIIKKINHRYFNLTTTMEDVYNVNVNTLDGSVRP